MQPAKVLSIYCSSGQEGAPDKSKNQWRGFMHWRSCETRLKYKLAKAEITRIRVNGDLRVVHYHRIQDLKHIETNII